MPAPDLSPADDPLAAQLHDRLGALLRRHGLGLGASELHGMIAGLIAAGSTDVPGRTLVLAAADGTAAPVRDAVEGLAGMTRRTLESGMFEFRLLLAAEDAGITERAESLADWCRGFLLGLGDGDRGRMERLAAEAGEAARDIMAISRMSPEIDADAGSPEHDLMELEEYVRVGVQLIFEELDPQRREAPWA